MGSHTRQISLVIRRVLFARVVPSCTLRWLTWPVSADVLGLARVGCLFCHNFRGGGRRWCSYSCPMPAMPSRETIRQCQVAPVGVEFQRELREEEEHGRNYHELIHPFTKSTRKSLNESVIYLSGFANLLSYVKNVSNIICTVSNVDTVFRSNNKRLLC